MDINKKEQKRINALEDKISYKLALEGIDLYWTSINDTPKNKMNTVFYSTEKVAKILSKKHGEKINRTQLNNAWRHYSEKHRQKFSSDEYNSFQKKEIELACSLRVQLGWDTYMRDCFGDTTKKFAYKHMPIRPRVKGEKVDRHIVKRIKNDELLNGDFKLMAASLKLTEKDLDIYLNGVGGNRWDAMTAANYLFSPVVSVFIKACSDESEEELDKPITVDKMIPHKLLNHEEAILELRDQYVQELNNWVLGGITLHEDINERE